MVKGLLFGFLGLIIGLLVGLLIIQNGSSSAIGVFAVIGLFVGIIFSVWFDNTHGVNKFSGSKDLVTSVTIIYLAWIIFRMAEDIKQGAVNPIEIYIGIMAVAIVWAGYSSILKQPSNLFPEKQKRFMKVVNILITVSIMVSILLYFFLK